MRIHTAFIKFKPGLGGKYKKSRVSCAGRCDTRVPVRGPQLGTQQPGSLSQPPGGANERARQRLRAALPIPGPLPPGAAPGAAPRDTGAAQLTDKARLHCNQSLTYCKCSMLWFFVCWVFLSAAGQKESSTLPGYTGCCRSLPCQGLGDKQASLLSNMDFRDIKKPTQGIAQKAMQSEQQITRPV